MPKPLRQLITDFRKSKAALDKAMGDLPRMIGTESVGVVRDNFRQQAYDTGQGRTKWAPRKDQTNKRYDSRKGGLKGSVFNSGNKILEQTGNLRDSIKYDASGKIIKVGVDERTIPYAEIHNEGKMGKAWGKFPFRMPKRQFMPAPYEPPNFKILTAIRKKLKYEVDRALSIFRK